MKVLSLFDGMSCGMLAMMSAGVEVEKYVAYEIDKYAVATSLHNFPQIEQKGDVFTADFTQYRGFDFLVGGSPCTYWSIAQKNNRETTASGLGWELFSQYVRALKESKPRYFIYENNKSMSTAIRDSIREAFGFEEICINSALVSAQNRQRFYWVGRRNADGTYSRVEIRQPEDRGLFLKDILDGAEPVNVTTEGKSQTIKHQYHFTSTCNICCYHSTYGASGAAEPLRLGDMPNAEGEVSGGQSHRVYSAEGKAPTLCARPNGGGATTGLFVVPVNTTTDGKSYALTSHLGGRCAANFLNGGGHFPQTGAAEHISTRTDYDSPGEQPGDAHRRVVSVIYGGNGKPAKATSWADGKAYDVHHVQDGQITIKGKSYPIKLADGYYIIRKLTVSECKRLQTVPEWYDFSCVSPTQAYKMLGNGWTMEVIAHLIRGCLVHEDTEDWLL